MIFHNMLAACRVAEAATAYYEGQTSSKRLSYHATNEPRFTSRAFQLRPSGITNKTPPTHSSDAPDPGPGMISEPRSLTPMGPDRSHTQKIPPAKGPPKC